MSFIIARGCGGVRRSAKSSTLATLSASAFLVLSGLLSFVPEEPARQGNAWPLRGTLAARATSQEPATLMGLHEV